ncbi:hypothetical protein DPEC_G00296480 [Dallia pectoralis]|uniref:Uncharacterized protein n=1 Tax=Dallia pectoralis TaxID=75939 RepID=A0ACC2FFC4_DALPE|nr:hypothetical protein DPEC_G00296480 [Dallia pectoralis]
MHLVIYAETESVCSSISPFAAAQNICHLLENKAAAEPWSSSSYFALRDNRIELVRASGAELTISISDISLSDEGQYTCSLFTMPVKTSKAFLTVLGIPERPRITGFTNPAMEGDEITLTCSTSGSKPAAHIHWFRNDKEVQGVKEVNATGKSFIVKNSLHLQLNQRDDGVAYTCSVEHVSLASNPYQITEVLQVHYAPHVEISHTMTIPQEGQYFKLECASKGNPLPDPVLWSKDGGDLPDVERMIVEGRDLTITSLNKTDNGTYRCEANNYLGTSGAEYLLIVYGEFIDKTNWHSLTLQCFNIVS